MALASPADFAVYCPSGSTNTTVVASALNAASTAAERYCGRSFASATQTEYYDGNGYPEILLTRWPVTAVSSVYLDLNGCYGQAPNAFQSNTLLTLGVNYLWLADKGVLQTKTLPGWWPPFGGPAFNPWGYPGLTRHGGAYIGWPKFPGCIKVTYTAGYNPIPDDLKAAVCTMANYILIQADQGGMITTTQSYIDTSVGSGFIEEHLARGNVPALGSARMILDQYRETRVNRGVF